MKSIWKIKNSIQVVDAAINHHVRNLSETYKHRLFSLSLIDIDEVVQTYKINYFEKGTHKDGDDLAVIKLRKIHNNSTEVTIFDSYWSSDNKKETYSFLRSISFINNIRDTIDDISIEKKISERQKLRDFILEKLHEGLKQDGFFDEKSENPQTGNVININRDMSGNIIIGNNNDLDS